jgi:hypothetical protein
MTLFLQWDTERECPVGFEKPYLNFFDPAEDDHDKQTSFIFDNTNEDDDNDDNEEEEKKTESQHSSSNNTINSNDDEFQDEEESGEDNISIASTETPQTPQTPRSMSLLARNTNENKGRIIGRSAKVRHSPRINKQQCMRLGCNKKPRFDSAFCSDGCGVLTMEKDLLCSLQYASDMHPYELRP